MSAGHDILADILEELHKLSAQVQMYEQAAKLAVWAAVGGSAQLVDKRDLIIIVADTLESCIETGGATREFPKRFGHFKLGATSSRIGPSTSHLSDQTDTVQSSETTDS